LRVQRFLETFGGLEATADGVGPDGVAPTAIVDCAVPGACSIVVFSFNDAFALGTTPLLIDPDAPPVPPPTVVVEPSTDLEDGQVVAVHGSGFTPGGGVYLAQCRAGASDETGSACDLQKTLRTVTADDDGVVETTVTVRRNLTTSLYRTVDCATVAEGCILGWGGSLDLQFERGNVPLHFAGDTLVDSTGLPRTGSDATGLAAWGALALVAGVVLRVATRRRRRTADVIPD
jgi:LPXTG-motif cell wall-anchored protein